MIPELFFISELVIYTLNRFFMYSSFTYFILETEILCKCCRYFLSVVTILISVLRVFFWHKESGKVFPLHIFFRIFLFILEHFFLQIKLLFVCLFFNPIRILDGTVFFIDLSVGTSHFYLLHVASPQHHSFEFCL